MPVTITFPPELPVSQRRDDIARAIRDNQVVIVAGATGSGKTTQLPKICLELGRENIGHTQPRRLAARTIAERIAEELGQEVGQTIGYQVRFTDQVGPDTRIKLMTDGILLNEMHRDRMLRKYDTIIIDEAHERSLNIDFLLGYLRQLLPQRPDLKLIITSATIDPQSFAEHFAAPDGTPAPIIEVSGRTFPVELRYRPLVAEVMDTDDDETTDAAPGVDRDYIEGISAALDELERESNGDVLVFLSGETEIRDAADALQGKYASSGRTSPTEILPLYGRLSSADQHRVFQPSTVAGVRRRIVLATNVAETSLTVPGIRYVIDAGTARISRYSVRSKVQRLPIEAISQASANQRSGRSGRTSDGIAIRLYSEEDFGRRPEYTEPEILRTNLAAVILQMISLGLGDIAAFPFLTPPDSRGIKDGLDLLAELGAVAPGAAGHGAGGKTESKPGISKLTRIGQQLAKLPIDPRFGRMVIESKTQAVSREVMAIVSGLTIQDPRERPLERRAQADQQHARFADPTSDFLSLLNLWNYLEAQQKELGSSAFRRLCKNEFLNYLRVREWQDVYKQLRQMAKPLGLHIGDPTVNPDGIHRALLAGLLSHIGLKDTAKKDYIGARQQRFVIFPGSALAKKQPNAVMSAELVETSRLFARMNAVVDPAWAEPLAGELCKRSYSEPHWEKKQGAVVAYERVTLYGVPIVPRRRIQFSRVDPAYARDLFIRHALVEGEWDLDRIDQRVTAFDRANTSLRKELAELEERTRRRDILFDDEAVFEFYQKRIPADVCSTRTFETWWRQARMQTPDLLTMTADALVPEDAPEIDEAVFPPIWRQGDQKFKLSYRFEPGEEDDGVAVQIPLSLLARLSPAGFDWQVPGLRADLVTALIKSLPKSIRRNVVPAADWARRLLNELPPAPGEVGTGAVGGSMFDPVDTPFAETLAALIQKLTYVPVSVHDFELTRVPAHLRMTFRVVDERGRAIASGKDLADLQRRLGNQARESVAAASAATPTNAIERSGLTTWEFPELPRFLDTRQGDNTIRGYPTLVDEGTSVAIRMMSTEAEQARTLPGGVRRLLLLATPSPVAYVQQHLTGAEKLSLATSPYRTTQALFDDCLAASVDDVLFRVKPDGQVFMRAEFDTIRDRVSGVVMDSMFDTVGLVARILAAARAADKALKASTSMALLPALTDARAQLAGLVYPGFVSATGLVQLRHLPRYLAGITARIVKLGDNPSRDRVWMNESQAATARFEDAGGKIPLQASAAANLVRARWLIEELRISLFAQELKAAEPVSLQRIHKALTG
ncbi:ATP-dependent RNA helicase HrpA [Cryobacterium sp. TMT1-21]|uniref:ATP-dependent RNA helicase HrpA n=1 Tax=Cryobacterium shii TaxID=1259235 RepID=A0AAQ2C691_9MICO|nr:ATP-dependent RNA helicase HrpA [Cryobacterium shii]TFC80747.1 ATP-dependent RNA helicase HrpA [Cryobacterium sp. TmT2-59]TFD17345.1 ATP-dependent RNA helicase HrpA [Cryobacterium sp. TMT1-21]TFD20354.1 ATP-dependent RNA helicase HrpA [Cryobacterium sp. TMT2-23]TFD22376.1 ATP-dependent RNA helicase HrpA [Cryobacterium sp. TMT4-10]TFD39979.1 ATP-dependent RNA helicase HrpA [Cryobacterium sp. TMT2-10]